MSYMFLMSIIHTILNIHIIGEIQYMSRVKTVCIRLTQDEYEQAHKVASAYGYTLSALIRYLLREV